LPGTILIEIINGSYPRVPHRPVQVESMARPHSACTDDTDRKGLRIGFCFHAWYLNE
jgi:hypothetical protein